jgi:tetratricopeptide (TPR) repeat protein
MKNIIKILVLLTIVTATAVNYSVYKSMKAQFPIRADRKTGKPVLTIDEVNKMLPAIPNVDIAAMPLEAYKVTYLLKEGKVEEALKSAAIADKINPYTRVGNYFRARIYSFTGELDKAQVEAERAFYGWPKNIDHYKVLNEVLVSKLDTTAIEKVFKYADSLFPEKQEYKSDYIKSLNLARAGYIVTIYLDANVISKDFLIGQWQRAYEYSYGKVVYDPNTVLSFSNEGVFKDSKGADYFYTLDKVDLELYFRNNRQKIKSLNLSYSPGNKTLILIDPLTPDKKPQYFKKISDQSVINQ